MIDIETANTVRFIKQLNDAGIKPYVVECDVQRNIRGGRPRFAARRSERVYKASAGLFQRRVGQITRLAYGLAKVA